MTALLNTESKLLSLLELMWWENPGHCDTAGPVLGMLWAWHFTPNWPSLSKVRIPVSAGQSRTFLPPFLFHLIKRFSLQIAADHLFQHRGNITSCPDPVELSLLIAVISLWPKREAAKSIWFYHCCPLQRRNWEDKSFGISKKCIG